MTEQQEHITSAACWCNPNVEHVLPAKVHVEQVFGQITETIGDQGLEEAREMLLGELNLKDDGQSITYLAGMVAGQLRMRDEDYADACTAYYGLMASEPHEPEVPWTVGDLSATDIGRKIEMFLDCAGAIHRVRGDLVQLVATSSVEEVILTLWVDEADPELVVEHHRTWHVPTDVVVEFIIDEEDPAEADDEADDGSAAVCVVLAGEGL